MFPLLLYFVLYITILNDISCLCFGVKRSIKEVDGNKLVPPRRPGDQMSCVDLIRTRSKIGKEKDNCKKHSLAAMMAIVFMNPSSTIASETISGKLIFDTNCASCHVGEGFT